MKDEQHQWLSFSIFFSPAEQATVFQKIKTVMDQTAAGFDDVSFRLQLNARQGQHMRLAVLTNAEQAREAAQYLAGQLDGFFSGLTIPTKTKAAPYAGIFMPFPENTVHFGLFSTDAFPKPGRELVLQQAFSITILERFGHTAIDSRKIADFCYTMYSCCLKLSDDHDKTITRNWVSFLERATPGQEGPPDFRINVQPDFLNAPWTGHWLNAVEIAIKSNGWGLKKRKLFGTIQKIVKTQMNLKQSEETELYNALLAAVRTPC